MLADQLMQIKISLDHIRPTIWRRLVVPAGTMLDRLHQTVQIAMGWTNSHAHVFETPLGVFSRPGDGLGHRDEAAIPLHAVAPGEGDRITYVYDMDDDWVHLIEVEQILSRTEGPDIPRCVTGSRACPPESCGGPWGYAELLRVLAEPQPLRYEWIADYAARLFNPEHFDVGEVNSLLAEAHGK